MSNVEEFGKRMCKECNIPYIPCIGITEDILAISIKDNDVGGKERLKKWLKLHNWVFVKNDTRNIDMCNGAFSVFHKEVTYIHNNHKIIIACEE